jgi:hypothetical protein
MEELQFPPFDYYLDQSDPDVAILRRQDGLFVAAFSARGATREGILEAAKEDCRELIQAHTNPPGPKAEIVAPVKQGTALPWLRRYLEPLSKSQTSKP